MTFFLGHPVHISDIDKWLFFFTMSKLLPVNQTITIVKIKSSLFNPPIVPTQHRFHEIIVALPCSHITGSTDTEDFDVRLLG